MSDLSSITGGGDTATQPEHLNHFSEDLEATLRRARNEALREVMAALVLRAGECLAPLRWTLSDNGAVSGHAEEATDELTTEVLAAWARFLQLRPSRYERGGTVKYVGIVDGRYVLIGGAGARWRGRVIGG